jgi:sulfur relay (sulfurtransferase) DsrC/TusE family protein
MNRKSFLKFRVTPLEKLVIKKKAENSGLSMSEFARASVLGQKISSKLTEDEIEIYKDLVKFHNNFQSISNAMKARSPSISNEVLLLADEMKKHLKKFQ